MIMTLTNDTLLADDIAKIRSHYSSTASAYNNNANVRNFPLLVVDDVNTANTTRLINNYINVLANTNYNYADTRNNAIYNVDFYKYRLDMDENSETYKQFCRISNSNNTVDLAWGKVLKQMEIPQSMFSNFTT